MKKLTPQQHMKAILEEVFPLGIWDDSADETARRVIAYLMEYAPAGDGVTFPFKFTTFEAKVNQLVVVRNIAVSSICLHHLLPFTGVAHVGYIPNKLMVGASKIPRLVDFWASRPTVQEYLTAAIATSLKTRLEAQGVAVIIKAKHTCMSCRGVRKLEAEMVTSEMRGTFLTAEAARLEFLEAIR